MSYAQKVSQYRSAFIVCLSKNESERAIFNAEAYIKTLQEMMGDTNSYNIRAQLLSEIEFYKSLITMIKFDGSTNRAKMTLKIKLENQAKEVSTTHSNVVRQDEWVADMFEKYLPATVTVSSTAGSGTGFFITPDGFVLTNHHVVNDENGKSTLISLTSGDKKIKCSATVVYQNKKHDIALLQAKIASEPVPYIPIIKDYSNLRPGTNVLVIGNSFAFGLSPVEGVVKYTELKSDEDLVYSALTNHGDSGGPVLNKNGECVGINKSRTVSVGEDNTAQGLTNATSAKTILKLLSIWGVKLN